MFAQSLEGCEVFVELRSIIGNWYDLEYGGRSVRTTYVFVPVD